MIPKIQILFAPYDVVDDDNDDVDDVGDVDNDDVIDDDGIFFGGGGI